MRIPFGPVPKGFVSDTIAYDFKDPLTSAFSKIGSMGAVIVTKSGEYYGIVDVRSATGSGSLRIDKGYPVGKVARPLPPLSEDSDLKKAIFLFYSSAAKALPYAYNGKIIGIVKRSEILKALLSTHAMAGLRVSDIMSVPLLTVSRDTNMDKARAAMKAHGVKRLVVLDKGELYGIFTTKSIMENGILLKNNLPELPVNRKRVSVGNTCERNIQTIDYAKSVEDALRMFVEKDISSLPVLRTGKPVGIITVKDVLEVIVKNINIQRRNIIISGMTDPDLREMEDEVIAELESFAEKADRFKNGKIDYVALNVKRIKSKGYELSSRLGFTRGGAISVHVYGYSLEATMKALLSKLYREAKSRNDVILTERKV